jgi:hypothetical protein
MRPHSASHKLNRFVTLWRSAQGRVDLLTTAMRRLVLSGGGCLLLAASLPASAQQEANSTDTLTVDQAVQIALANNRNLKIVSLSLDSSKEKLLAEKTRRLPSFSTYAFASQLLDPISFTVQAG